MMKQMNVPGYESLADVLLAAYEQAAVGKGAERHANDLPFHEQPMQQESDALGTDAGLHFQVRKKLREGSQFKELERWEREALGAINYIVGMVVWRRRQAGAALYDGDFGLRGAVAEPTSGADGPDVDGWYNHDGGPQPERTKGRHVDLETSEGSLAYRCRADVPRWRDEERSFAIVRYRVCPLVMQKPTRGQQE